jgi:hypothetical protein
VKTEDHAVLPHHNSPGVALSAKFFLGFKKALNFGLHLQHCHFHI